MGSGACFVVWPYPPDALQHFDPIPEDPVTPRRAQTILQIFSDLRLSGFVHCNSTTMAAPSMKIRKATTEDLPQLTEIYNYAVTNTTATFDLKTFTVEQRIYWFDQFSEENPIIVCCLSNDETKVVGYAYYLPYRAKEAYKRTKETTIYVHPDYFGKGVGTLLYTELIAIAKSKGIKTFIAVLGGDNKPSEALHKKFGFVNVGNLKSVGFKFNQWLDTHYYQLMLS